MFDTAPHPSASQAGAPGLQRARGRASADLTLRAGRTRLAGLHQSGCAKAFLPRGTGDPEVVFLNTAGGLTGGDRLDYALTLGPGARATATTQTAERAYASPGGAARARVTIAAGPGAAVDWLPQETILFENSALERRTEIALAGDARALLCEAVVLGRAAMGETVTRAALFDRRAVTRDGAPVLIDAVALGPESYGTGPAGLGGARAVAMVALVADGAEDAAGPLGRLLAGIGDVEAGVSGWDGRCVARLRAGDGWPLRRALAAALTHLRQGPLPRVWQI